MRNRLFANSLGSLKKAFVKEKLIVFFVFVFIIGLLSGSLLMKNSFFSLDEFADGVIREFTVTRVSQPFFSSLLSSFVAQLPLFFLLFILAYCAFGAPFSVLICLYKGSCLGLISGYLYASYGIKGISFFLLIVLPGAFFAAIVFSVTAKHSFSLSLGIFKALFTKNSSMVITMARQGIFKFMTLLFFLFLTSVLDAIMSAAFIQYFNF